MEHKLKSPTKAALFLPHVGEFGFYLLWYVRAVHLYSARWKVVCCRRGEECLFPDASAFFYDWDDQTTDREKVETLDVDGIRQKIVASIGDRYGAVEVPDLIHLEDHPQQWISWQSYRTRDFVRERFRGIRPSIRVRPIGPAVDVVVTARHRDHHPFRNYPHWQRLVDFLVGWGCSVGLVGSRESSQPLSGVAVRSWDRGGVDACVDLLTRTKLMVTTDTGPAHLNVLCGGCPMLVIQHEDWRGEAADLTANDTIETILLPREGWGNPEVILGALESYVIKSVRPASNPLEPR